MRDRASRRAGGGREVGGCRAPPGGQVCACVCVASGASLGGAAPGCRPGCCCSRGVCVWGGGEVPRGVPPSSCREGLIWGGALSWRRGGGGLEPHLALVVARVPRASVHAQAIFPTICLTRADSLPGGWTAGFRKPLVQPCEDVRDVPSGTHRPDALGGSGQPSADKLQLTPSSTQPFLALTGSDSLKHTN